MQINISTTSRSIDADSDRVFQALTDPLMVASWRSPGNMKLSIMKYDAKANGPISYKFESKDPTRHETYKITGSFISVTRPQRIIAEEEIVTDITLLQGKTLIIYEVTYQAGTSQISVNRQGIPGGIDISCENGYWDYALTKMNDLLASRS
ncbi:MAG TPA: SRPBCC domain-containing protein [Candidatus Saccharimonadales bacterium]|nr:SRPBCC domain-containing protein [Candidatus Saccharimonadales bacterium]